MTLEAYIKLISKEFDRLPEQLISILADAVFVA